MKNIRVKDARDALRAIDKAFDQIDHVRYVGEVVVFTDGSTEPLGMFRRKRQTAVRNWYRRYGDPLRAKGYAIVLDEADIMFGPIIRIQKDDHVHLHSNEEK